MIAIFSSLCAHNKCTTRLTLSDLRQRCNDLRDKELGRDS